MGAIILTIATCLWAANSKSLHYSTHSTELDVEKLYRGFKRNLSVPFRFVCWTDTQRTFKEPIEQRQMCIRDRTATRLIQLPWLMA